MTVPMARRRCRGSWKGFDRNMIGKGGKSRIAGKWCNDCPMRKSEAIGSSIDGSGRIILSGGLPQPWVS